MSNETKATGATGTVYFDGRGPDYTDQTLRLAKKRAKALSIRDVVVASYMDVITNEPITATATVTVNVMAITHFRRQRIAM